MKLGYFTLSVFITINSFACLDHSVEIEQAFIKKFQSSQAMTSGYFIIKNTSKEPLFLKEIKNPGFSTIEMHDVVEIDGSSKMVKMDSLEIPPNESIKFQEGGKHLMFFNPKKSSINKKNFNLEFVFLKKGSIKKIFDVR